MKRLLRQQNLMRAREAMQQGLKVAIDCSLEKTMSDRVSKIVLLPAPCQAVGLLSLCIHCRR